MDKGRFERFVEKLIADADTTSIDWCYSDGTSMTEDARAFLKWYQQLNQLWLTMKRLYSE